MAALASRGEVAVGFEVEVEALVVVGEEHQAEEGQASAEGEVNCTNIQTDFENLRSLQ